MLTSIKISRNGVFLGSDKHRMLFFLLVYVKMPTIVGTLTFMKSKISCSAELSMIMFFFLISGTDFLIHDHSLGSTNFNTLNEDLMLFFFKKKKKDNSLKSKCHCKNINLPSSLILEFDKIILTFPIL